MLVLGCYVRVSTEEQNLETQRRVLREFLEQRGFGGRFYEDLGKSGDTFKGRDGLRRLRADLKAGKLDGILVYRLDRLSRKTVVGLQLVHSFLKDGVRVLTAMEGLDIDPSGEHSGVVVDVVVPLLFALAQNEQRVRRERMASGIARARAEGKYKGRRRGSWKNGVRWPEVARMMREGLSRARMREVLDVDGKTLSRYMKYASERMASGGEDLTEKELLGVLSS